MKSKTLFAYVLRQWFDHNELKFHHLKIMVTCLSPFLELKPEHLCGSLLPATKDKMHIPLSKMRPAFVSNSASWQCSATCCQDNTVEAHRLERRNFVTSTIFHISITIWLSLFQASWQFLTLKIFRCTEDKVTAFKNFLPSKLL